MRGGAYDDRPADDARQAVVENVVTFVCGGCGHFLRPVWTNGRPNDSAARTPRVVWTCETVMGAKRELINTFVPSFSLDSCRPVLAEHPPNQLREHVHHARENPAALRPYCAAAPIIPACARIMASSGLYITCVWVF